MTKNPKQPFDGSNIQKVKAKKSYAKDPNVEHKTDELLKSIKEIRDGVPA